MTSQTLMMQVRKVTLVSVVPSNLPPLILRAQLRAKTETTSLRERNNLLYQKVISYELHLGECEITGYAQVAQ